jgi:hypothetical protein
MKKIFIFSFIVTALISCKKGEGPGGTGIIKGKVHVEDYSGSIFTGNEYDGADIDVFIIYGEDNTTNMYDEKITTSYDGSFEFRYLRPGFYRVFVYSKEPSNVEDLTAVPLTIDLQKGEIEDLGTITIKD